jgi:hypothetical protein
MSSILFKLGKTALPVGSTAARADLFFIQGFY